MKKRTESSLTQEAMQALSDAVAKVVEDHRKRGRPLAVWREGKAVWVPSDRTELFRETQSSYEARQTVAKPATGSPAGASAQFTNRQGQYLAFIHSYIELHGQAPAEAEIQEYFRVSPPSVHQMILTLERRGFIRRTPFAARSIRVLVPVEQLPGLSGKAGV